MADKPKLEQRYPLQWPQGYKRMPSHHFPQNSGRFGGRETLTFAKARNSLLEELKRIGAKDVIISSNHRVSRDGVVVETTNIKDHGVAVYFERKGKRLAMARDGFNNTAGNMRSLALAIEGLRQLERHGGAEMMEKAFTGFAALPDPNYVDWRATFGFKSDQSVTEAMVQQRYRELAKQLHSDVTDLNDNGKAMTQLNIARDRAIETLGM